MLGWDQVLCAFAFEQSQPKSQEVVGMTLTGEPSVPLLSYLHAAACMINKLTAVNHQDVGLTQDRKLNVFNISRTQVQRIQ
jgi:hypothetical protein